MKKEYHNKMIKGSLLSFCIFIMMTIPVITIGGQQSFESPPSYYVIMFGRIFNPHIKNDKLCFRAINVICLIDEFYDSNGWEIYYLGWFREVKIPKYYTDLYTLRRIFVIIGCNELPEF